MIKRATEERGTGEEVSFGKRHNEGIESSTSQLTHRFRTGPSEDVDENLNDRLSDFTVDGGVEVLNGEEEAEEEEESVTG